MSIDRISIRIFPYFAGNKLRILPVSYTHLHINRFRNTYPDYEYTPITPDRIQECLDLEAEWCKAVSYTHLIHSPGFPDRTQFLAWLQSFLLFQTFPYVLIYVLQR